MTDDVEQFEQTSLELFGGACEAGQVPDSMIEHYLPRVRAFVRARMGGALRARESESDIVQSVCRRLVENRAEFEFRSESEFRSWLFTAALNNIREKARFWQRDKRAAENEQAIPDDRSIDSLSAGYSGVFTPSRILQAREQIDRLETALEQLPEDQREVIALARVARLPFGEVGKQMNRSPEAARQLLGRALRKLSILLREGV